MKPRVLAAAAIAAVLACACSEGRKPVVYHQGEYQGKADTAPWSNARYNNDQAAWERDIRARNRFQNEYVRMGGQ